MRHIIEFAFFYAFLILAVVIVTTGCLSLSARDKERLEAALAGIPTHTPTPTATPLPTPTPKPPDLSVGRIQHDLPEFAASKGISVVWTSRGNMLDMRGRTDFDAVFREWCDLTGGAAMPAMTAHNEYGEFHQCE